MHTKRLIGALALGLGLTLLGLLSTRPSAARSLAPLHRVAPDCTGISDCFTTLQAAVNHVGEGYEIRVATGVYTGAQTIVTTPGYTYTQVVIITKSLTLRGGYTTADWSTANPISNPTVINAGRHGRCITILGSGSQTVTVEGFTLTGGDYTGLGNPPAVANRVCERTGSDCGGGLFAQNVALILRTLVITNNIASRSTTYSDGGGVFLRDTLAGSLIEDSIIISNSVSGSNSRGGGVSVADSSVLTITRSAFIANRASTHGGGLSIFHSDGLVLVEATDFISNTATEGGAIRTSLGKGLSFDRLRLQGNRASSYGAAFYFEDVRSDNPIGCSNLILSGNSGPTLVYISDPRTAAISMAHLTVADNPSPTFLWAESGGGYALTVALTNTLIVSATSAFAGDQTTGTLVIRHTNTLTRNVTTLHQVVAGAPTFVAINPLGGDPKLDATYHLQAGSAAINAGVDAGVTTDIDGDPRPSGSLPDVGADEYRLLFAYLPLVLRNQP
jgi:hypothetical protein